jgi:hypothetical protein
MEKFGVPPLGGEIKISDDRLKGGGTPNVLN